MIRPVALLALAFAALALCPVAAEAQRGAASDPCRRGGDHNACYVAREQDWLGLYGLLPAERRRAAGDAMVRAMFVDGYSRDVIAIEFVRAPGHEPTVSIYAPREFDRAPAGPALSAAIPLADWEEITDRARHFDRTLVPLPPSPPGPESPEIILCTHAWFYVVEVTDPAADVARDRLRRRAEDACEHGLTQAYATYLSDVAVRLLPACAALDRRLHRNSASILGNCATFSGDRLAAAAVHNRLGELRGGGHPHQLELLQSLFSGATLDWNGERIDREVPQAWLARTSDPDPASFFTRALYGESASRVRVDGFLERWTQEGEGPAQLWQAPVEMVWELMPAHVFQMRQARVGAFARTPSRCNPNQLTSADNC